MDISVQVEGLDRIEHATAAIREAVAQELAKGMYASVKRIESDAKRSIAQGGKSGRVYKRGNVTHTASAPGEAPATDTGLLVGSIRGDLDRNDSAQGTLTGKVSVGASYGRPLEFGTAKIAARPFLTPALEKNKAWIGERLSKAVRDAVVKIVRK